LLVVVNQRLWDEYVAPWETNFESRIYSHATSTLFADHGQLMGGFLLVFHFNADIHGCDGNQWGKFRYALTLDDGILTVDSQELELQASGCYGDQMVSGLRDKLANEIRQKVRDEAILKQAREVPLSNACNQLSECNNTADALASLLTVDGMKRMGIDSPTDEQMRHARCALGQSSACRSLGRDPDAALNRAWTCAADTRQCELVHEPDPDSTAFALAATNAEAQGLMCQKREIRTQPPVSVRPAAVSVDTE